MHHSNSMLNCTQKIPGQIPVSSCKIDRVKKDITLLSDIALILSKASLHTGVHNARTKFTLSLGTYTIDYFNAKVKKQFYKKVKIDKRLN